MRIQNKPLEKYPFYLQPFFWIQKRKYGDVLFSALAWARSPKLFLALSALYGMLNRRSSPLDPALRALITVRVSQINHCSFCVDVNSDILLKRGVSQGKLEALPDWRSSKLFSKKEKAVLSYLEEMTNSRLKVVNTTFDHLRLLFKEDEIIELTALIAFQNMSSKFNAALDVPAQGFCKIPPPQKKKRVSTLKNFNKHKKRI